ncbi:hypothetical protein BC828DRAFT_378625 [Blastocladiella britannica]|nr:hypothetical protein BC828DRAFT_378625 [Blastocladiella britannica]
MISSLQSSLARTFSRSDSSDSSFATPSSNAAATAGGSAHSAGGPRPSMFNSSVSASLMLPGAGVPRLHLVQYADYTRAVRDLRSAVQLVSNAAETLQRVLSSMRGCRTSARELSAAEEADLAAWTAVAGLLARTHGALGTALANSIESPLVTDVEEVHARAVERQRANERTLDALAKDLRAAESAAAKTRKNRTKDLYAYQQSLAVLNALALEIKRVEADNMMAGDELAELRLPFLLATAPVACASIAEMAADLSDALRATGRAFPVSSLASLVQHDHVNGGGGLAVPIPPLPALPELSESSMRR